MDKLVFASSDCIYPIGSGPLQTDPTPVLTEDLVGPSYVRTICTVGPMVEMTLQAYCTQGSLLPVFHRLRQSGSGESRRDRYHGLHRPSSKAPFDVWGTGQIRTWTLVSNIVAKAILAAERVDDGTAITLATMEHTGISNAVREVLERHRPPSLGWVPQVKFVDAFTEDRLVFQDKDRATLTAELERKRRSVM